MLITLSLRACALGSAKGRGGRGVPPQSEAMLEEDAARFDTFLKENDERVQAALRKADAEARGKQEKVRPAMAAARMQSLVMQCFSRIDPFMPCELSRHYCIRCPARLVQAVTLPSPAAVLALLHALALPVSRSGALVP